MKKSIFAVCDLEERYAERLTQYMNERKNAPFEVLAFTSLERLMEFSRENPIELLLISTEAMCDEVKKLDVKRIMILSDGEVIPNLEEHPAVYKYQASETLLSEVMNYYAETGPYVTPMGNGGNGPEIRTVYSPIGRIGKTVFAMTLADVIGEEKHVLYLNLEDFNGFEEYFDRKYQADLSDLIYFSRQKEGNLLYKLNGMIQTFHNMDYIPPAFSPSDLREVRYEEWLRFIREIGIGGEYDVLVLDLGNRLDEYYEILRMSGIIYVPVLDDDLSGAKIRQFEKNLCALDYRDVAQRIKKLHLPEWDGRTSKGGQLEKLMQGSMRSYVRSLLSKEKGRDDADDK